MQCPISRVTIDERLARWIAGFVALTTLVALTAPIEVSRFASALLVFDFLLRVVQRPRWSPFAKASAAILDRIGGPPRLMDAAPKRFAARIGLGFAISLTVLAGLASTTAFTIVGSVLLVCALLESMAGVCVGCHAWTLWQLVVLKSRPSLAVRRS